MLGDALAEHDRKRCRQRNRRVPGFVRVVVSDVDPMRVQRSRDFGGVQRTHLLQQVGVTGHTLLRVRFDEARREPAKLPPNQEDSGKDRARQNNDGSFHRYSCRMKATRSAFSCLSRWSSKTKLKNSTVSSKVNNRPSCKYGGESLTPRSGNVLIKPSTDAIRLLTICGLKNRSVFRSCISPSVYKG